MEQLKDNINLYFTICPIYDNIKKVKFGIRNYETKNHVIIEDEKLIYDKKGNFYELYIKKENNKDISPNNIFNESNYNKINQLIFLQNLFELHNYDCDFSCIKKY